MTTIQDFKLDCKTLTISGQFSSSSLKKSPCQGHWEIPDEQDVDAILV